MNLLFLGTAEDVPYLPRLKPIIGVGHSTRVITQPASTWTEILFYCRKHSITGIFCTQSSFIERVTQENYERKTPSLDTYAGSLISRDGIEVVFLPPLPLMVKADHVPFLISRFVSKLTNPKSWHSSTKFSWEIANEATLPTLYERFSSAFAMALDIETFQENLAVRCIGFCGVWNTPTGIVSHSIVIPLSSEYFLAWCRKFCALPVDKITQNGKYDIAYLMRYNSPPAAWYWDTATIHHCTYCELPKDLESLNAFYVRDARAWKHEGHSGNLEEYYLYNARDTHATLNVFLAWIAAAPAYARNNYLIEFDKNYPCIVAELTGIKLDKAVVATVREEKEKEIAANLSFLRAMTSTPTFNPNSPVQVKNLLKVLGCGDITSTVEQELNKASYRHPLNARILDAILEIRGLRKLVSTYLKEEGMDLNGRVLYALNPHSTDTARLASKEHHFWCGLNIQNIPRGDTIKQCYVADSGFLFGEADYEQAESRDTAYITGDTNLISAVESPRDFHAHNASAFFGVPYEKIVDPDTGKTLDKPLRDLSKRVNHGANYCMGASVLVSTMGLKKIFEAKRLLGLRGIMTAEQIAEHLLSTFGATYPVVKEDYPKHVVYTVNTNRMLVGATGWTRYCFGNTANKRTRNAYVAHGPQSLNACTLNLAWHRVFYNVWLPNHDNFKLCAQIHDSILFQYRKGHEYLIEKVCECMEIPITVKDISGISRTLLVPVDVKSGGSSWSNCK